MTYNVSSGTLNSTIPIPCRAVYFRLYFGTRSNCVYNNNNNNNNIISKTMFMVLSLWQSHCESSPGSFDECRTAPSGRRPKTKPDDLGCESVCTGCQSLHPPSPSIIITQPENRYSFYRPTEDRQRWFTGLQTVTHHSTNRV